MVVGLLDAASAVTRVKVDPHIRLDAVLAQEVMRCLNRHDGTTGSAVRSDFLYKIGHRPPARHAHECSIVLNGSGGQFW